MNEEFFRKALCGARAGGKAGAPEPFRKISEIFPSAQVVGGQGDIEGLF